MLFPFFRKKPRETMRFDGCVDYHSHLLPGVDDGVQTLEESLECLDICASLGFSELWCTPHVMEDMPNKSEELRGIFSTLRNAYTGPLKLHLAAEYMMDGGFEHLLQSDDFLTMEDGRVLVETSFFNGPVNMGKLLDRLFSLGHVPVLAHPERYAYMELDDYQRLHDRNVQMQLNIISLDGFYGRAARERAEWLLAHNMYSIMGSDAHSAERYRLMAGMKKRTIL